MLAGKRLWLLSVVAVGTWLAIAFGPARLAAWKSRDSASA